MSLPKEDAAGAAGSGWVGRRVMGTWRSHQPLPGCVDVHRERARTRGQALRRDAGAPAGGGPERIFQGRGHVGSILLKLGVTQRAAAVHGADKDFDVVNAGPALSRGVDEPPRDGQRTGRQRRAGRRGVDHAGEQVLVATRGWAGRPRPGAGRRRGLLGTRGRNAGERKDEAEEDGKEARAHVKEH